METSGISEAVQVMNVVINGSATALKLTGELAHFTGHQLKELFKFIMARIKEAKLRPETLSPGEHSLGELLKSGNEQGESIGAMVIPDSMLDDFVKYANENKVAFSKMFHLSGKDETTIVYKNSDALVFQAYIMQNEKARVSSLKEYMGDITTQDRVNVDHMSSFKEYNNQLQENNKPVAVTIDKKQIVGNTEDVYEIKVNAGDEGVGYVKVPHQNLSYDSVAGAYILVIADSFKSKITKEQSIVKDENGKVIEKIVNGKDIRGEDFRNAASEFYKKLNKGNKDNLHSVAQKTADKIATGAKMVGDAAKNVSKVR